MTDLNVVIGIGGSILGMIGLGPLVRRYLGAPMSRYETMERQLAEIQIKAATDSERCHKSNQDLQAQISAIRSEQVKDGLAAQLRLERALDRNTEVTERAIKVLEHFGQKIADATPVMGNAIIPQPTLAKKDPA